MPPEAAVVEVNPPPVQPTAPTTEIHVTPASVADKGPSQPAPKKGTAMERMFGELHKKAEGAETPAAKPEKQANAETEETAETTETATETAETTPAATA